MPSVTKRQLILDAIKPRANANFWGAQVADVASLPATGKPGEVREVLDDGDGKPAGYQWTGAAWEKAFDVDLVGVTAAHILGGASHTADTLANLNSKISDATLLDGAASLDRANHTGTQLASTVSDFSSAVAAHSDVSSSKAHASGDGSDHADVASNTAALSSALRSDPVSLTFGADAISTIEERVGFPFALSEIETILVGPIGVAGTGTITFEKGMQGGTNILASASFDVSTLTDNTMEDINDLNGTAANYQGGVIDVVLVSMINCTVPHMVKITFKRQ